MEMLEEAERVDRILLNLRQFTESVEADNILRGACAQLSALQCEELPALTQQESDMVRDGYHIEAIKSYKSRVNCTLLLAKSRIDQHKEIMNEDD